MSKNATNLDRGGRSKRWWSGFVILLVCGGILFWFDQQGFAKTWRLLLFLPLFVAGLSFFQAAAGT